MKTRTIYQKLILSLLAGLLVSCASEAKKEPCPSEAEEPLSVCRAREACESQLSSTGVGVGFGMGNIGLGVGRNLSSYRYERCLDHELEEQKKKMPDSSPSTKPAAPSKPNAK